MESLSLEYRLEKMKALFNPKRLREVKSVYLDFEIKLMDNDLLDSIVALMQSKNLVDNHSNSCILYLLNLTNTYDPSRRCVYRVYGQGPDIDTDFSTQDRDILIRKLQEKYGYSNVAKVSTYAPYALKRTVPEFIKLLPKLDKNGKVLTDDKGEPIYGTFDEGRLLADQIPDSFRGRYTRFKDLNDDEGYRKLIMDNKALFDVVGPIDRLPSNNSIHACALIISQEPLSNYIPLRRRSSDPDESWFMITQWEGGQLEKLCNLVKFDTLALDNLDINKMCCDLIGRKLLWLEEEVPVDDIKTFDTICKGFTAGLFQIEGDQVVELIQKVQPRNFQELSDINALIRPGPKDAGLTADYVKWRETGHLQNKIHPLLDDLLKKTGGVLVYQEQVMSACQLLAGMSLATADDIRKAMGKKDKELMAKYKGIFTSGCLSTNGIPPVDSDNIWKNLEKFADYGFNVSHSLAYALLAYQNAYLKTHYPSEFMISLLTTRSDKPDRIGKYISEARRMNVHITSPDINTSDLAFTKSVDGTVVFGFNAVKDVGAGAIKGIMDARKKGPFKDFFDFMNRINRSKVNSGVVNTLVKVGAFDSMFYDRQKLLDLVQPTIDYFKDREAFYLSQEAAESRAKEILVWELKFKEWEALKSAKLIDKVEAYVDDDGVKQIWSVPRPKKPVQTKVKEEPVLPDYTVASVEKRRVTSQNVKWEGQYCKYFISGHPLDFIKIPANVEINYLEDIDEVFQKTGCCLVVIAEKEEKQIKRGANKGKDMCIFTVEDHTIQAKLTLFAKFYENPVYKALDVGDVLFFNYKYDGMSGSLKQLIPMGQIRIL